jgi:hypothetical protein
MNLTRRDFFKAFAAAGIAVAVAERAIVQAIAEQVPSLFFGDARVAWLTQMHVVGMEVESRPASVSLARPGASGPLFRHALNAYQANLWWSLPVSGQIAITREHNLRLEADFDGIAQLAFYIPDRGIVHREYALLRERDPVMRRQILQAPDRTPLLLNRELT